MKKRCDFCNGLLETREKMEYKIIDNIQIEHLYKYLYCPNCNEEIYDEDLFNENVKEVNTKLRINSGLITADEIRQIGEKYNIGNKSLSLILGFGEIQIDRYLKSGNPSKEHSEIMKLVLNNPFVFEMYLYCNKNKISRNVYKKSISKTKQIQLANDNSKIYLITEYILKNNEDITNMSIQKILYFINGFSKKFLNYKIITDKCEAWVHGPVYRDLYLAFCTYYKNFIDFNDLIVNKEIELDKKEKAYIDKIIPFFENYSGSALRNMSHLTDPWIIARNGINDNEFSNKIIDEKDIDTYFDKIIEEYKINKIEDVKKYSEDLFNKAIKNV